MLSMLDVIVPSRQQHTSKANFHRQDILCQSGSFAGGSSDREAIENFRDGDVGKSSNDTGNFPVNQFL
jgi:hypothetical protein